MIVYNTKAENLQDLPSRITAACALVDTNLLSQTRRELVYHLDVLRGTNGAHIEVYLMVCTKRYEFLYHIKQRVLLYHLWL